jgi:hypothetical protein
MHRQVEQRWRRDRLPAYAIVRVDTFQDDKTPWVIRVTVTRVVWDEKTARSEVERLHRLNGERGAVYFWQFTRVD